MRRTTLLALLAAAAVAGWIALFEREETAANDERPVFDLNETEILAVEIERPGEPVVRLARDGAGFVVAEGDGPESAAAAGEVDLLLQNVAALGFEREIEGASAADLGQFGLAPPGLTVRVFPKDGEPDAEPLVAGFGDETPAAGNRYLSLGSRVLVASAFARDNFDLGAWDLRDRRVFRLEAPAARRLLLTTGDGTTGEISREQGFWSILRPYRFAADPYEASQLASRLLDAEMSGVVPDRTAAEEDSFGLGSPRLTAELDLVVGPQEEAVSRTVRFGGESRTPPGVFARSGADALIFVVGTPLFDALLEAAEAGMGDLRSLDLFRFAGFRAIALLIRSPDGEFVFERREGEEGREWTLAASGGPATVVDTVAVEDLLYRLNSTEAEDVGEPSLPQGGAAWTIAVTEEIEEGGESDETGPETVHLSVSGSGEVRALRAGDERTLVISEEAWGEVIDLLAEAREPAAEP